MLASGALLAVAMPPRNVSVLAWVALVPILRLRRHAGSLRMFAAGYALSLVPIASVVAAMGVFRVSHRFFAAATLGAALAFAIGIVAAAAVERRVKSPVARLFVFPALAVVVECALRYVLRGLPVPSLAWTQPGDSVLVQSGYALRSSAPVTFLIVLVNVGIEDALAWTTSHLRHEPQALRRLAPAGLVLALFSVNAGYGVHRIATVHRVSSPTPDDASSRRTAEHDAPTEPRPAEPNGRPQTPQ